MTVHGVLEIKVNVVANVRQYSELYTTFFNFLTGTQAQSLGIQRIAYNRGAAYNGTGVDYPGTANSVGNFAWSVWCWSSASIPFYLLLQESTGSIAMGSPGLPFTNGLGSVNTLSLAVAFRGDGTNPWNGTMNDNGADTKGAIVWQTGSAGDITGSTLYVFPRANSGNGTAAATRQLNADIITPNTNGIHRSNLIVDENNFLFVNDLSNDGVYGFTYFGKYTPRSGSNAPPYVMLNQPSENGAAATPREGQTWGNTTFNTTADGGIASPAASSVTSGTIGCIIGWLDEIFTTTYQPNLSTNPTSYDNQPIHLWFSEAPYFGYAGSIEFINVVYNVLTHDTSTDLSKCVFGGLTTAAAHKLLVPWNGVTIPGSGASNTGSIF